MQLVALDLLGTLLCFCPALRLVFEDGELSHTVSHPQITYNFKLGLHLILIN